MLRPPNFLAIGHVAKDLTQDSYVLGGAVTFAALTAKALGWNPAVVTSCGRDVDFGAVLPGIPVHVVRSMETTTFLNVYDQGRRRQLISGVAEKLSTSDVPNEWRMAPLVLLTPLAQELDYSMADIFKCQLVGVSTQGWLRTWDSSGNVLPCRWSGEEILPKTDVAIFSDDDLNDEDQILNWADICPVVIHTKGRSGCSVYFDSIRHDISAFPANEVDPTGAGDVFAASYLIRFQECGDALEAAKFASATASFCVEAKGTLGIPTRTEVGKRLRTGSEE